MSACHVVEVVVGLEGRGGGRPYAPVRSIRTRTKTSMVTAMRLQTMGPRVGGRWSCGREREREREREIERENEESTIKQQMNLRS